MFFCEDCRADRDWPGSSFKSHGRCECCNKTAVCHDVPSTALPIPGEKAKALIATKMAALEAERRQTAVDELIEVLRG